MDHIKVNRFTSLSIDLFHLSYCYYINMVSLLFSNVAIELLKSWDQLSLKTLMLKAPSISESIQLKLFEVAKSSCL